MHVLHAYSGRDPIFSLALKTIHTYQLLFLPDIQILNLARVSIHLVPNNQLVFLYQRLFLRDDE